MADDGASDLRLKGFATRRAVLGDAHVDRAVHSRSEFDAPFQDLITDAAWGHVWSGDAVSRRERSMITLALLAALGHWDEFAMHVRASANTGASRQDVREALMHVAIYAGVPAANHAIKLARATYEAMDAEGAADRS